MQLNFQQIETFRFIESTECNVTWLHKCGNNTQHIMKQLKVNSATTSLTIQWEYLTMTWLLCSLAAA